MTENFGELLAAGHALLLALGLMVSMLVILQGVQDTTDEGVFPVSPPTEQVSAGDTVQEAKTGHEAGKTDVYLGGGTERQPASRDRGRA